MLTATGRAVRHSAAWEPVRRWDGNVVEWFDSTRGARSNALTMIGTRAADTESAVALTAVGMLVLARRRGVEHPVARWRDPLALGLCVVGQLLIYLASAALVARPRPPVPHLDKEPPTASFPSGHTSAAVAVYGGTAVLLHRRLGRRAVPLCAAATALPLIVGTSRVARGMHYPTDVAAGAISGAIWSAVVLCTL